ncbi:MAG: hypothetical protein ACOVP1_14520 [Bacteroidia bacterium]
MTIKTIELKKEKLPLVVSVIRNEFYLISFFTLSIYFVLMVLGFYWFMKKEEPDYLSYEFLMGMICSIQFFIGLFQLFRNSLVIWEVYEHELVLKSIYLNREQRIKFNEIVDYQSEKLKIRGRITQSDGHLKFSIQVNFDGTNDLVFYSFDQYTYANFFEIRQAILDKIQVEN